MKINQSEIDEINNFWGSNRLTRWSTEKTINVNIPENSKLFLSQIGVPNYKPFDEVVWFFDSFRDFTRLKKYYENLHIQIIVPLEIERSFIFAVENNGICCFCILPETGKIIYFNPEVDESIKYCNSSIEMFCYFLTKYYQTALEVKINKFDEIIEKALTETLVEQLEKVDFEAFEIEDSFWNTIILDIQ